MYKKNKEKNLKINENNFKNYFYKIFNKKNKYKFKDEIQKTLIQYRLEQDPKKNKETTPPENEKISFRCLWVFEIYPPNYINNLINGIDKLIWNVQPISYKKPSKVIKKAREGNYVNWYNLGRIESKEKNISSKITQLPEGVNYVNCKFIQCLPSTSILSTQFVFNDEISNILEEKLKKEYTTYLKRVEGGYHFNSPTDQKKDEIKKVKEEVYRRCYKWFQTNFPGLFSNGAVDGKFPTCEFITLKEGKPYSEEKNIMDTYINILDIRNVFDAWKCDNLKGILLEYPSISDSDCIRIKIAGNSSEILSDKDLTMYGGIENHGIENYFDNLDETLVIWVLYILMRTYKCHLSRIRDSISDVSLKNVNKATYELQQIRKDFAILDRDIPYFANEIKFFDKMSSFDEIYKFKPLDTFIYNKDEELFENILKYTKKETNNMINEHENIRHAIETTSNIILSVSNEKLMKKNIISQNIMIVLTIVILISTVISLIILFVDKSKFIQFFQNLIQNLK